MNTNKDQIITDALMNIEPMPLDESEKVNLMQYTKIPFGTLASLGAMFSPFTKTVQEVVTSSGGTLYRAVDDLGNEVTNLFAKNNGKGFISVYHNAQGEFRHANLIKVDNTTSEVTSIAYNPSTLFMGAAMISMQKEISEIKETQHQILTFLHDDKHASLKGDLLYLGTVINDYQYNLYNDTYKTTAYIKIQDIMQNAKQNVVFYTESINKLIDKDAFLIVDKSIKNTLDKMLIELAEYRLALYLYGISTFLNVLLIENFNEVYLNNVIDRLEDSSYQYRELYTRCYNLIEERVGKSLDTLAAGFIANASKELGNLISKLPLISRSQLDENLINTHDKINLAKSTQNLQLTEQFLTNRNSYIQIFIDNLKNINRIHNRPTEILFDNEGMYIRTID